ncbi:nicotinate phosphoribosyltransferase [Simkania negevensis]|uniref:Nicotinate phosphoribosyltransferase n=1 Tax=Simkania negevensis TaxID=83561 RepID=A0ABS3AQX2_9BACT|nr:nicotinate phosphoribosyltransferase [Simkania negevensis]
MRALALYKNTSLALLTDLYQLTMAYSYWKEGISERKALYHLFFRRKPFKGGFVVAAGLEAAVHFIELLKFSEEDLSYLEGLRGWDEVPLFDPAFLDYLANLKFTCDVHAVPEGELIFPQEPLVRVTGPILQCQLLETPLLTLLNFPTLIATKAARICHSARGDSVIEFGLRRAQGIDGGVTASRAAFIGGCSSTSNVMAGKFFGVPVKGTHAHSWVMAFDDELDSFYSYARAMPNNCVFLVDTYDTLEGVKSAIEVGLWLKTQGKKMVGVRLDSGDLAYLSIESRRLLDEAGFHDTLIMASNELDEYLIADLKNQGAKIAVWGVGTALATARDCPALDGVYKLSAICDPQGQWLHKLKISEQLVKVTNPGILQVRRFYKQGSPIADIIYDELLGLDEVPCLVDPLDTTRQLFIKDADESRDLLKPVFLKGERVYDLPSLQQIQENAKRNLDIFHPGIKRLVNPHEYPVGLERQLEELKLQIIKQLRTTRH